MREIKFRAWDKENDRMLFPDDTDDILFEITIDGIKTIDLNGNEDPYAGLPYLDTVVMQYTGLKDKNGIEIYEGDVLFHPLQGRRKVFYPYSETVASYGLRDIDNGFGSTLQDSHAVWEVIGNIYENPELLEREAK